MLFRVERPKGVCSGTGRGIFHMEANGWGTVDRRLTTNYDTRAVGIRDSGFHRMSVWAA